ncbi:hypothetical protein PAAG_03751 [Paracoccidioides lutzii Pb01]|uniref:Uncharacterized protein n=1 Tax=Paracoccidioides lutzii (strain ATCC MYA-826 / Pb01) TaxID=502779 RepID=C1GZ07_PARBA|nr:hypothetical protein PAAG_03751 [Paracoccidioides lutzii Pb01]EEH41830.2 hypothetical protein PAAG_03751 [Paracoccidioides lutzii Pb01]
MQSYQLVAAFISGNRIRTQERPDWKSVKMHVFLPDTRSPYVALRGPTGSSSRGLADQSATSPTKPLLDATPKRGRQVMRSGQDREEGEEEGRGGRLRIAHDDDDDDDTIWPVNPASARIMQARRMPQHSGALCRPWSLPSVHE